MSLKQNVTSYLNLDVDETGVVVDATPVRLASYFVHNKAAATTYLKLYNKATAPTSSDTPTHVLPIPAGASANLSLDGREYSFPDGLGIRATTGVAHADTGAPAANDLIVNFGLIEYYAYSL
jgi:hypothetical protein